MKATTIAIASGTGLVVILALLASRVSGATPATGCPSALPGPELVFIPAGDASYCMDAREVNQREYGAFVEATRENPPKQVAECAWNDRFEPALPQGDTAPDGACLGGRYDPEAFGDHSMGCVDWCDAKAYCEWAGKRLCGGLGRQHETPETKNDPESSEWHYACTAGGNTEYPYGADYVPGKCADKDAPRSEGGWPAQLTGCTGTAPPYDQIQDLTGGLAEWTSACEQRDCHLPGGCDYCAIRGGGYFSERPACDFDGITIRSYSAPGIGFRCCAAAIGGEL